MPFSDLTQEQMHKALTELDQAIHHHEQWHDELNRTLICGLSPDQRDLEKEAHRNCRFGQWIYCDGTHSLAGHPAFSEIETLHQRLHNCARTLLRNSAKRDKNLPRDYDDFSHVLKKLRMEILTTKGEIEDSLYKLDPLTGASNRVGMLTRLREQQALVKRELQSCCLAMLDLDHFKNVNDTYGHVMGDKVLATFGRQLKSQLRPYDLLFRYGGEEFLICMPEADIHTGGAAIERLRRALAGHAFQE